MTEGPRFPRRHDSRVRVLSRGLPTQASRAFHSRGFPFCGRDVAARAVMAKASLKALACNQMLEALARLMLATTRMDAEQIEALTCAANRLAYDAEHDCIYKD